MWNGRSRLEHGVRALEHGGEASVSVNAPSVVACMCAKSITGRTQETRSAISSTSSIEPSSLTRPITSTPNGTARSFCSSRSRSVSSQRDDVVERLLAVAAEPEAGVDDDHLGARGGGDAGAAVERAERHLRLLLVGVAGEREQRCVDRKRDVVLARDLAQPLRPRVVHPEAASRSPARRRSSRARAGSRRRASGESREGQRAGPRRIAPTR